MSRPVLRGGAWRRHWPVLMVLVGAVLLAVTGLEGHAVTDYEAEAARAFWALRTGDLPGFLQTVPAYGGSFVLRAPFAWAPALWGGGELAVFRAVSLPGVLACAALAFFLVRRMRAAGHPLLHQLFVAGIVLLAPQQGRVIAIGHAEELVGAILCIAAVLAAPTRPLVAATLLGLAVANKPWALIAVPVVLAAVPRRAVVRAGALAGAVTLAVVGPLLLLSSNFVADTAAVTTTGAMWHPWQLFYLLGEPTSRELLAASFGDARAPVEWIVPLTRPLILGLPVLITGIWWWHSRGRALGHAPLLLLALLLHLRCVLDPWNNEYYSLPAMLALLTWELVERPRRAPVVTLVVFLAHGLTFYALRNAGTADLSSVLYLAWALPLAVWMGTRLMNPERRAGSVAVAQPTVASA